MVCGGDNRAYQIETNPEVTKDLIEFDKEAKRTPKEPQPQQEEEDSNNNNTPTPEDIEKQAQSIQDQLRDRGVTLLSLETEKLQPNNNNEPPQSPSQIKKPEYGLFPPTPTKSNYSELPAVSEWYFGPITRQEAEDILKSIGGDSFLIRTSSTIPGCYVLSRWTAADETMIHYIVKPAGGGYEITDCPTDYGKYLSLAHMVEASPTVKNYTPATKSKVLHMLSS